MHSASFGRRIYEKTGSMPVLTAGSQIWGTGILWVQSLLLHLVYRSLCLECFQHLMSAKALRGHNFRNRSRIIHNGRPSFVLFLGSEGWKPSMKRSKRWNYEKQKSSQRHFLMVYHVRLELCISWLKIQKDGSV